MTWATWSIWDCLKTGVMDLIGGPLSGWGISWMVTLQRELWWMSWCQSGKQWWLILRGQYWDWHYSTSLLETWTVGLTLVWTAQATWRCAGICILGDTQNLTGCGLSAALAAPAWAVFKGPFQPQRLCDLFCAVKQMFNLISPLFFSCFLWWFPLSNFHLNTCRLFSNVTYPLKLGWYLSSQILKVHSRACIAELIAIDVP